MTTPVTPSETQSAETPLSPEQKLKMAWDRHGNLVYGLCALVAVAILAKGGWNYVDAQKELGIKQDFAECTSIDSYRSFAAAHPGHALTGVAEVTIADNSYATGKFSDAASAYQQAVADLPNGPIRDRAKLGQAMALVFTGKSSDAETNLRQILNDTAVVKPIRCEAGYHLAGLALAAGRRGEIQQLAEQELQIDPSSPFAERTLALRGTGTDALSVPILPSSLPPPKP